MEIIKYTVNILLNLAKVRYIGLYLASIIMLITKYFHIGPVTGPRSAVLKISDP